MYKIEDILNYFNNVIDTSKDGVVQADEIKRAQLKQSIFTDIIKPDMSSVDYTLSFIKNHRQNLEINDKNKDKNLPYKLEESANTQDWDWKPITKILSKDEVDGNIFNIKTQEGISISPLLNFNSEDGKYMLKVLSFDSETFMNTPKTNLPEGFNPDKVIELGKNQGQNVDKMHNLGYTGKGITCAIIDSPILTNHKDIKSSLVGYEVMDNARASRDTAYFHGQATSDILVGDEAGVAPDAKLVYFAEGNYEDRFQALQRIIEINKTAKPEDKIKVVSLSWGINKGQPHYEEFKALLKQLYDSGVFVATADFNMLDESLSGSQLAYGTLDKKNQQGDPNDFSNYVPINCFGDSDPKKTLFVVAGDRTVASSKDPNKFRHDSKSSTSWTVPALAGIYTCALQCANEIGIELTPSKFWEYASQTGKPINFPDGRPAGKVIDAEALVKYIKSLKK